MSQHSQPNYGGQAVIEGVMFGGKHTFVTAVRTKDQSIVYYEVEKKEQPRMKKLKKIPFLRGVVALIEASANGSKHLNFSSEQYDEDNGVEKKEPSKLRLYLGVAVIGILSFIFGKLIFTVVPALLAEWMRPIFPGHLLQNIVEGLIKFTLLLLYIYVISLTPLIKRVFQYHGAEHKVINTFEHNKPLTVEQVKKHSRLHYRCGSSFILFTVFVGMVIYYFVPSEPLSTRILYRIALIPVVLGVAYEVLQATNKVRNIPLLRFLGYPGLMLQLLTTKEPTDDQMEVAIHSFNQMRIRDLEIEQSLKETSL
ncbi:DUF1385 domain-containing protein [Massilibacterium senegalense]|uniref:DUF1385 domain-containing protein n=1 Tax=Massilibacterium senegalense TaxID=1632858 RepID=UPI0007820502|nr:DUF1385 domain-containing protein [Massilibacterium senegalense]